MRLESDPVILILRRAVASADLEADGSLRTKFNVDLGSCSDSGSDCEFMILRRPTAAGGIVSM